MKSISFSIAQQEDDGYLRDLMRSTPMPGEISVVFEREPSYFHAIGTEGKYNQTIVVRDTSTNEVIAMGSRSIKSVFINGEATSLGYLSSLRILPRYRNATVLGRGYQYLRKLHGDNKVRVYLSTIIDDNSQALEALTSGRCSLPRYHEVGVYYTHVIQFTQIRYGEYGDMRVVRGSGINLGEIINCLQRNGKEKQFYPYYTQEDFILKENFLRDFRIDDFYIALKNDRVVGVLAKWDQGNFKQTVISGYSGKMRFIKPLYNFAARIKRYPLLPELGCKLSSFYISFIAVDYNNPDIFARLLKAVYNDSIRSRYSYMIVGLSENDPLSAVIEEYPHIKYKSKIFVVYWEDGEEAYRMLDNRIPYLEVATL